MLTDYFKPTAKRGRPPKRKRPAKRPVTAMSSAASTADTASASSAAASATANSAASVTANAAASASAASSAPPKKKVALKRTDWSSPDNEAKLRKAVEEWDSKTGRCEDYMNLQQFGAVVGIPKSTLGHYTYKDHKKRRPFGSHVGNHGHFRLDQQQLIADTLRRKDRANDGTGRKGAVDIGLELRPDLSRKQVGRATDAVRKKFKSVLTGRIKAQGTTTKRSAITVRQQLRWHELVDAVDARHARLNVDDGTGVKFGDVADAFKANLDEESIAANAFGGIIIGDKAKKKHEKITDDSRVSATFLRTGNARGDTGPTVAVLAGKKKKAGYTDGFMERHGAASGSTIVLDANAFMTDETWIQIAPTLAKGIRTMPIVRDHPTWWVRLTLDGFSSHVMCLIALMIFWELRIEILKEDGHASHVEQPFDRYVAKTDKLDARYMVQLLARNKQISRGVVDQQVPKREFAGRAQRRGIDISSCVWLLTTDGSLSTSSLPSSRAPSRRTGSPLSSQRTCTPSTASRSGPTCGRSGTSSRAGSSSSRRPRLSPTSCCRRFGTGWRSTSGGRSSSW